MEQEIAFVGEWLGLGNLGHLATIVSMIGALWATVSFFYAAKYENIDEQISASWQKLARWGFYTHAAAVATIVVSMFILILNHRFEYKYVWQHSSLELPTHYIISCFWEGQEGSFLLWTFWHAVLGSIVIATARKWENSVMTIICFTQIFLAAMLIGIYFFDYKIGSSPFILMRDDPSNANAPIFSRPNYLEFLKDGNGLNPLLQNYWMVIHPPTLFLGFALTLIPFAYCLAAVYKKNFDATWIKSTLTWALAGGGVLGLGIMMGGAWAYEALSFGGYWAWDPVENASLVPWITLLGGIHTLLAYKHTQHALRATLLFFCTSFWLILYSTFLTRSGILGDTSVHAFTDLGMSGQLLVFMFSFIILSVFLFIKNWKSIPNITKEEHILSREFWLFVGSLLLLMFAIIVSIDTSWPVINKILGTKTVITEPVAHYNRYSVWFGIIIASLTAFVQFLRYKTSTFKQVATKISIPTVAAIVLTVIIAVLLKLKNPAYILFLFSANYTIFANLHYLFAVLSGKIKIAGASVAHFGFGLMLLGILISASQKEVISINTAGIDYGKDFKEKDKLENVLLIKNQPIKMGDYWVTYKGDSISKPNNYYVVEYQKKKNKEDLPTETFTLYPNAQINPKMGLLANPATKHYATKDIFTHVSSVPNKTDQAADSQTDLKEVEMAIGDTLPLNNALLVLKAIRPNPPSYIPQPNDIAAGAQLQIVDIQNQIYNIEPVYVIRNQAEVTVPASVDDLGITVKFERIFPEKSKIKLAVIQQEKPTDFIIMKAIVFPYINLLWIGTIVMVIGFVMSCVKRLQEKLQNLKKK